MLQIWHALTLCPDVGSANLQTRDRDSEFTLNLQTSMEFVWWSAGEIGQIARTTALHGFTCAVGVLRAGPVSEQ